MYDLSWHEKMSREVLNWIDDTQESMKKIFDNKKIAQEIFSLSENYWLNTMKMISNFQEHYEKVWLKLLDNNEIKTKEEGKKMLENWMGMARVAHDEFTKTMEDNWKKVEQLFGPSKK